MSIVLKNLRIITGTGEVIERGTVVVTGKKLASVGAGDRAPSAGDRVFDLSGKTVLPGLIDCHVHVCLDGSPDPVGALRNNSLPTVTLKAAREARLTLEAGVTTFRDMGGKDYADLALRDGINAGLTPGPRMLASGRLVCMTGGHGWEFGCEADGVAGVRAAVRAQIKAGADLVKLMATGGVLTRGGQPGAPQLTEEEMAAGVEEARKAGRRTATHAQGNEGIKNALRAGITSIEHGIFLDDEAIGLLLEKRAFLVPTLNAPFQILQGGVVGGVPAFVVEKTKSVADHHLESIRRARKAGVTIAMGTDAGTPFNRHGENLKELDHLVGVGFTPMEAIVAATRTASELLGLSDTIGTLEPGKTADLVVVDGNPLDDITLLQRKERILAVMKDGVFFHSSLG